MKQSHIATQLGCSQMQVSRRLRRALRNWRRLSSGEIGRGARGEGPDVATALSTEPRR